MDDDNDVASNPLDEEHLPAVGEVDDENGDTHTNPDISDDIDLDEEDDDGTGIVSDDDEDDVEESEELEEDEPLL